MAHSQSVATKTVAAVEKARSEVNAFKKQVTQLVQSGTAGDATVTNSLMRHVAQAEALVEKAETTVKRIKTVGRVPPRPTASVPATVRAKRALAVLLSGVDVEKGDARGGEDERVRNLRQKLGSNGLFLSAAGKPMATPIREEDLNATLKKVSKETDLFVGRVSAGGVGFECRNVFRAFMWFKNVDGPAGEKPPAGKKPGYIVPEHIAVFRVDELSASRWSCSKHAIFNVLTERANAAIRYFMAREKTGEEAFMALAEWLARHKSLFSAKGEDRRLAFDASRGIFLPACIHSFDGSGEARFTRGTIPVRNNSAQPTVRVPTGSQTQGVEASAKSRSPPHGAGTVAGEQRTQTAKPRA